MGKNARKRIRLSSRTAKIELVGCGWHVLFGESVGKVLDLNVDIGPRSTTTSIRACRTSARTSKYKGDGQLARSKCAHDEGLAARGWDNMFKQVAHLPGTLAAKRCNLIKWPENLVRDS